MQTDFCFRQINNKILYSNNKKIDHKLIILKRSLKPLFKLSEAARIKIEQKIRIKI